MSLQPMCQRQGCTNRASHYPRVAIPPAGGTMQQALTMTFGLAVCRDHADELKVADVMCGENAAQIRAAVVRAGLALPDTSRAELRIGRLGDDNWRQFQTMNAKAQGGGRA